MNTKPFIGSRTKLRRAVQFIDELNGALEAYNKIAITSARFDITVHPPVIHIDWTGISPIAGAMLGDTVHNLRASLDLMACELVRKNNENDKDVYFPFSDSAESLDKQIKQKKFSLAGADAVELLRKFAPYKGGNVQLRAIHDLDVIDKHRAVLETQKEMQIVINGSYNLDDTSKHSISVEGSTIQHFFSPESALANLPVIQTLKELVGVVEEIINEFEILITKRA